MKSIIAIALLIAGLFGNAAQAKLPTVCEATGKCAPVKQTKAQAKAQLAELQRYISWARSSAQILERATSQHGFLPLADKPVDAFTVKTSLESMQSSLKSAEKIVCERKCQKHTHKHAGKHKDKHAKKCRNLCIQRIIQKRWDDIDYLFVQADYKLYVMQMFAPEITPGDHTEEELNFELESYGRSAAEFQELMEKIKVQVAIIEAYEKLPNRCK